MLLNERKTKILEAIINDYIRTAEPIGSRTIAKKYDLGISSATIRNEMSDLEEMGLIVQPHASSGRVPSDKGYRLYVDQLMHQRELTNEEISFLQQLIIKNIGQIDSLMQETARALALLTNYTTVVSEPKVVNIAVRHIQFVPLDESSIVLVLVTDSKAVKNYTIKLSESMDYQGLSRMSMVFNKLFAGRSLQSLLDEAQVRTAEIAAACSIAPEVLAPVWEAFANAVVVEDRVAVYTSGTKNILGYPEFSDLGKARAIFDALEEKELLIALLNAGGSESVSVIIGSENNLEELKNCSVIKTGYTLNQSEFGSIGVIGPTRMDYSQVVPILSSIVKYIDAILKDLGGG